ncbi:hypothetical protein GCM10020229_39640 [Kitasatospora albolonga]|uniref:hypothetical protein n=1 Tax=Kitasatospora albolonga TaxID=68173 RepID=UPI0031EB6582
MIETIVAVVGAFSTLAGVGIGVAGYRSQAALVKLQGEQLRRQIEDSERARRSAEAAERRAEEAERRAELAGRQRAEQEEQAERRRERQQLLMSARDFTVEPVGNAVRAAYRGRHPVTEVRLYWRDTEITPGGRALDLYLSSDTPSTGEAVVPVPGMPEGTRAQLAEIHAEYTDVQGRRWRRRGDGGLLLRGADGRWSAEPTVWLDLVLEEPFPVVTGQGSQTNPWGRPQPQGFPPRQPPFGYPAVGDWGTAEPSSMRVASHVVHGASVPSVGPKGVEGGARWPLVLALAGIGAGVAALSFLALWR